jgi:hypothetical protein
MEAIQTRMLTPLSLSDLCAQYLRDRFKFNLNARSALIGVAKAPQFPPLMLPIPLTSELDRIAIDLVDAFLNRGELICAAPSTSYSEDSTQLRWTGILHAMRIESQNIQQIQERKLQ